MPFYSSILQHGLMNKTGISQSCMICDKTTKFALLFALVGAMMVVVPMLTEQAYARTEGRANTLSTFDPPFTNVIGKLDAGKWLIHPRVIAGGLAIEWATAGSGLFGGDEKGSILANVGPSRHVTFSWTNPDKGPNTCKTQWNGNLGAAPCQITQDSWAHVTFKVTTFFPCPPPPNRVCQR